MEGTFGMELESLRVTRDAFLSNRKHPFKNESITRDFAECQMEFITDVYQSVDEMYDALQRLYHDAERTLETMSEEREYIWPFSNPTYLYPGAEIPIAKFDGDLKSKTVYREYLAKKYGKKRMLYSGIHYNYSLSKGFFDAYTQKEINEHYLRLSSILTKYAWLPVLLTAASPLYDVSFVHDGKYNKTCFSENGSRRMSE